MMEKFQDHKEAPQCSKASLTPVTVSSLRRHVFPPLWYPRSIPDCRILEPVAGPPASKYLPQAGFLSNSSGHGCPHVIPKGSPPLREEPRVCFGDVNRTPSRGHSIAVSKPPEIHRGAVHFPPFSETPALKSSPRKRKASAGGSAHK